MSKKTRGADTAFAAISRFFSSLQDRHLTPFLKHKKQFLISGSIALAFALIGHQLTSGKSLEGQTKAQSATNAERNASASNSSGASSPYLSQESVALLPVPTPLDDNESVLVTPDLDLTGGNITLDRRVENPVITSSNQPLAAGNNNASLQGVYRSIQRAFDEEKLDFNGQKVSFFFQDLKSGQSIGQSEQVLRYPASVVKPFWTAVLYDQITRPGSDGRLDSLRSANRLMIKRSDNNAASVIIDALTGTSSADDSSNPQELKAWVARRTVITNFFRSRGRYSQSLRIGQKVFPITKPKLIERPQKNELRLRLMQGKTPIRNAISVLDAVNVIVELYQGRFTNNNPQMQQEVQESLNISWSDRQQLRRAVGLTYFNPVRSFFSEDLPSSAYYYGKSGWTSDTRNEVALIIDGNHQYILAVFTDGASYARNENLFPKIGRYVHSAVLN